MLLNQQEGWENLRPVPFSGAAKPRRTGRPSSSIGWGRSADCALEVGRLFPSTKPHSLVTDWASAQSLSREQSVPQVTFGCSQQIPPQDWVQHCGLSSSWSKLSRLVLQQMGVLLPQIGEDRVSQADRIPTDFHHLMLHELLFLSLLL